jgi:hypothetical protein
MNYYLVCKVSELFIPSKFNSFLKKTIYIVNGYDHNLSFAKKKWKISKKGLFKKCTKRYQPVTIYLTG